MARKTTKTTVKKDDTEEKVELQIKSLSEESQKLLQERHSLNERMSLINQRLMEIQGGINVLIPLLQKK